MDKNSSQKQILKATGIVGGAEVVSILVRIARTKIIAVLLGPAGVGILGLYQATLDIVRSATGFGLNFSAVRDIAEANGSGDQQRISRTIAILRRWVWFTGLLGLSLLVIFREQFSRYAFDNTEHTVEFMMLAIVPLFAAVSGGQLALLRGVRRIGDMARAGVLGAIAGFALTVPLYWLMGLAGIVPAMMISALVELGLSFYFARKIRVQPVRVALRETISGGAGMIRLGLFTVVAGLTTTGTMYLVRILISNKMGIDGVGQFQAAWTLSSVYVGLVLGAMAADYYPRLSAINRDDTKVCKLVNEQTEMALLMAGPMIIGMLCYLDIIIAIFYSNKFSDSSAVLLWQMSGNLFKVMTWPMGFVMLAKNRGDLFIFSELLWNTIFLGTIWAFWEMAGLVITGIAFVASYFFLMIVTYIICRRMLGFRWSSKTLKYIMFYAFLIVLVLLNKIYVMKPYEYFGGVLFLTAIIYSYKQLQSIVDVRRIFIESMKKIGIKRKKNNGIAGDL